MAVRVVRPERWEEADFVEVESDLQENLKALVEVEDWASDHGFMRTNEGYLRRVRRDDGVFVRRAVCYRPAVDELRTRDERIVERRVALGLQAS